MTELASALAVLALTHWVSSAPGIRPAAIRRMGLTGFRAAHSLVSLAVVGWLIVAYGNADGPWLWMPPAWGRWLAVFGMPLALWLVVARLFERPGDTPAGIYRITAVPGSLGLLIWASLHLLNLGEARAILLFGTFAAMALAAMIKNWKAAPPARRHVGLLPGFAILSGRAPAGLGDLRALPALLAIGLWGLLLILHPIVIGPDPLAGIVP
jgi:uncharacterized membrane protein